MYKDMTTKELINLYQTTKSLKEADAIADELRSRDYRMIGFGAWTSDPEEKDPVEEMRKKVLG